MASRLVGRKSVKWSWGRGGIMLMPPEESNMLGLNRLLEIYGIRCS